MLTNEKPKRSWQDIALELSVEPSNSRCTELADELNLAMEAADRQQRGMAVKPPVPLPAM
jgi:hypothetical protein